MMKDKLKESGIEFADILGVAFMFIPFIISFIKFPVNNRLVPFLPWPTKSGTVGLMPDLTSGLIAVIFYIGIIVRYGIFKKDSYIRTILEIIRCLLGCWVLAALISPIIGSKSEVSFLLFKFNSETLLLLAILLTWLGVKSIAGYSWFLFLIAAFSSWKAVSKAMGGAGAFFIISLAIALLLQVKDYSHIQEFSTDFMQSISNYSAKVKKDMNAAVDDATEKAKTVGNIAHTVITKQPPRK